MSQNKSQDKLKHVWSVISHDLASPLFILQENLRLLDNEVISILFDTYHKAREAGLDVPSIRRDKLALFEKMVPDTRLIAERLRQLVSRWNYKFMPEKYQPSIAPIDIVACVNSAVENYQTIHVLADKSRIKTNLQDAMILADTKILEHILYEVFANAEYAANNDNNTIVNITSQIDGDTYALHIKNRGQAIKASDLPNIFDAYFSTKIGHVGLGLTFCKSAIEAMGGAITCEPLDDGVLFILEFELGII